MITCYINLVAMDMYLKVEDVAFTPNSAGAQFKRDGRPVYVETVATTVLPFLLCTWRSSLSPTLPSIKPLELTMRIYLLVSSQH